MKIDTSFSTIFISTEITEVLKKVFENYQDRKLFILVDENTKEYCLPLVKEIKEINVSEVIEIKSGEQHKSIDTVKNVWDVLTQKGADRSSLLINLGGGIIGDLGGFSASTFKRGMDFINIPTTLLSQVDASAGGKTGINFLDYKNEIGVFSHPKFVIIDSFFNKTLDKRNILSGWAEMLKHALLYGKEDWKQLIENDIKNVGFKKLNQLIARSVAIKNHFVESDPNEKGLRKALNLGHTIGHAFESFFMHRKDKLLHGEAVAHGLICELYLSNKICNFPMKKIEEIVDYLLNTYPKINIKEEDYSTLFDLITHDKKNESFKLNFTLLEDFGKIKINQNCTKEDIIHSLNWYNTL